MLLLLVLQLSASSSVTTPQTVLTVKDQPDDSLDDDDLRAKEGGTRVSLALRVCLCARNEAPEGEEAS